MTADKRLKQGAQTNDRVIIMLICFDVKNDVIQCLLRMSGTTHFRVPKDYVHYKISLLITYFLRN